MDRNVLGLSFFTGKVFLVNFDFSAPKVPRVASLPFFAVLFVTEKIKISSKIIARCCACILALFYCCAMR